MRQKKHQSVNYYPIVGWLRAACSYIKRRVDGSKWDDQVGKADTEIVNKVIARVKENDP